MGRARVGIIPRVGMALMAVGIVLHAEMEAARAGIARVGAGHAQGIATHAITAWPSTAHWMIATAAPIGSQARSSHFWL
jgi:hypothetical protein